jgi:D-alanine transfer protein
MADAIKSPDFVAAQMPSDGVLFFGSSEFDPGYNDFEWHPTEFFTNHNIGYEPVMVGRPGTQSLLNAINAGALANKTANKKVVFVVSPWWFSTPDNDPSAFKSLFSWEAYKEFMENPDISNDVKEEVKSRCVSLGEDESHADAYLPTNIADDINGAWYSILDDLSVRQNLADVRATGKPDPAASIPLDTDPDWQGWMQQATAFAGTVANNNDFGMFNRSWDDIKGGGLATYDGGVINGFPVDSHEYEDMNTFLDVCQQTGLDPLVVILPVNGLYYNSLGMSAVDRDNYYQTMRDICADHGVSVADFSDKEDEKYFLSDLTHPGWRGWIYIEEAVYDFLND